MGSRKFGNLLVFVFLITGVLELAALLSAPAIARALPGGPYAQIGALAVFFNSASLVVEWLFMLVRTRSLTKVCAMATEFIPKLQPRSLRVYGLNFSDKSSTYLVLLVVRCTCRTSLCFLVGQH